MRVIFLRPNSRLTVTPPPLGLGYLSHALKIARGDETMILDGRLLRLSPPSILAEVARFGPDLVGVTSMTFEAPEALDLIARLKERWPKLPVVLGGPHPTGFGPSLLEACAADYLVLGEGEEALVELLHALEKKKDPAGVKGLAWRENGRVVSTGSAEPIREMERLVIDWEGIRPQQYFSSWRRNAMNTIARSPRRLSVFTSRGCPQGCAYCHQLFGRKYRPFPEERTVAEMVRLRDRYRLDEFEIIDDNFNHRLDHAKAFMTEVVRQRLDRALAFANGLRADRMDEELLGLMVRAGTYRIDYAIESASPRIQALCHKRLDLEKAREVVNMTARRGIITGAYYMLGFPGETEEEMAATVEYALSLQNHIASFFYMMPFPGTEFAESSPEASRKTREVFFGDASSIAVNLSAAPDRVLQRMRRYGYKNFYFSPGRVRRIIKDVPLNFRLLASALAVLRLSFREAVNY